MSTRCSPRVKGNRLVAAERGEISVSGGVASLVRGTTTPEARRWYLDNLGNWTGNGTDARGLIWGADNEDSTPPFIPDTNVASIDHAVDKANAITSITTDGSPSATLDYDLAGNLVSDGVYFLQYDGFNP